MEKIEKYTQAVIALLSEKATVNISENEKIHEQIISDTIKKHYLLMWLGFNDNDGFVDRVILHFQVKEDGKVWILANWTEDDVAEELVRKGVDKNDIVLGFQPPYIRPQSGYAVA